MLGDDDCRDPYMPCTTDLLAISAEPSAVWCRCMSTWCLMGHSIQACAACQACGNAAFELDRPAKPSLSHLGRCVLLHTNHNLCSQAKLVWDLHFMHSAMSSRLLDATYYTCMGMQGSCCGCIAEAHASHAASLPACCTSRLDNKLHR